jgi:alkanesulfonate monooxygenase SsuD/methylene tetrahydromethanopterin reductase-like flavin-dependent oxidoreductase (luciferase family)
VIGSPDTVRKQLSRYIEDSGSNYFLGNFSWGSLTYDQIHRSLELFATEVMPALTPVAA